MSAGAHITKRKTVMNDAMLHETVELAHLDVQTLAAGYRASKVIGSSVVNTADETIGKIDDLLVSHDGKQPYAVLSIGGFLGIGTRLVVIPYDTLRFEGKTPMLPGGTKDGLKMLPEFKYATAASAADDSATNPPPRPTVGG
jgi:hypothetical protein